MSPTRSAFGPETEHLYRDVSDDSSPLEKALWHLLAYADDVLHGKSPDPTSVLDAVEQDLRGKGRLS